MVVTQAWVMLWLGHFLWPFLRVTGLFLTAPLYSSASIPMTVKAALAAALAASLAAWLPHLPAFPADPAAAITVGLIQLGLGAMLGLGMQIVLAGISGAGEMAGLAIGLNFAELQFREVSSATPVLYDIMFWTGLMGYFAVGGPFWLFAALAHSLQYGVATAPDLSWNGLSQLGGGIIGAAVWLAMPALAVSLSVNIIVGLMTVFAPQLNLLTIGFPLLILVGLWVFAASTCYFAHDIRHLFLAAASLRG